MHKPNHVYGLLASFALINAVLFACGKADFYAAGTKSSSPSGAAAANPGSDGSGNATANNNNSTNTAGSGAPSAATPSPGSGSVTSGNPASAGSVSVAPSSSIGRTTPGEASSGGITGQGSSDAPGLTTTTATSGGTLLKSCSQTYTVPGTANPYLAGEPNGTGITYQLGAGDPPTPVDTVPGESPVLVTPIGSCIVAGNALYFSVSGSISFSQSVPATNANGNMNYIVSEQKGSWFGKSDITAPMNSLIGVFLADGDPASLPAPSPLDFSTQGARDYLTLSPQVGQIFFIGTGLTSMGAYHQVVVPQGATRLYFAVMDIYQWNNNLGSLSGSILTAD